LNFFKDLKGAIVGGEFYHHILKRPAKKAWTYYLILVSILAIIVAIFWSVKLNNFIDRKIAFFTEKIKKVEFVDGKIVNMPLSHKVLQYENWTIYVDTLFVDEESVNGAIDSEHLPALFVGPKASFIATSDKVRAIPYPATFSKTIDAQYLADSKSTFKIAISICCLIGAFLYKFIIALVYSLLIITPMILFKFRRQGMKFGSGFKVALYLSSFQLIVSTILDLAQISFAWSFIVYILFYLFYIGGFVNIDFSDDVSIEPTANA
jgi:hypothetical protein